MTDDEGWSRSLIVEDMSRHAVPEHDPFYDNQQNTNKPSPSNPSLLSTSQHCSSDANFPTKLPISLSQPPDMLLKRKTGKTSQFFYTASPSKKPRPAAGTVSCIEIPSLSNSVFGLIQEELAHHPFQLLVAVIFLNKTKGKHAIPIFREVIEAFPTPEDLERADVATLRQMIRPLGLFNQRAATLVSLAKVWNLYPPTKGRRVKTPNYPNSNSHKGIKPLEVLSDDDAREGALEIGHLPGIGAYAFDSWRIFCRDELRQVATGWNGEDATSGFEPEWKKVLPSDKELRAYLKWMWLKEGWIWNPVTGEKNVASEDIMKRAEMGELDWTEVHGTGKDGAGK
jgi:methyl-CpG-binding domain protein 4